ncbi:hypothetical protein Baya_4308 [Bagarius yarrelli]|uniref:Uncharacterized protein n=1 Tax=Bagarius yarrelli TaxID=175774 RepID=A0A556TW16_BAGYA|nr:hypothetical protein Baya_4308 [Bagarius yarrelli]
MFWLVEEGVLGFYVGFHTQLHAFINTFSLADENSTCSMANVECSHPEPAHVMPAKPEPVPGKRAMPEMPYAKPASWK